MSGSFILRRFIHTIFTLFLVLSMMWAMFRLLPGDPLVIFLGQGELSPEILDGIREAWGLNDPLYVQYFYYIRNFLTGDLGMSFFFREPVAELLITPLLNTMLLMLPAVIISIVLGIGLGSWLGWRHGSKAEVAGSVLLLVPRTMPNFWVAIVALSLFSYNLGWFPTGGMRTMAFVPENAVQALPGYDVAIHLMLPLIVAIVLFVSDPAMIMRTSMVEVTKDEFVTYGRSRGLRETALKRLARRNALLPVVTYSAIMVGYGFGGQVLLETVFSWPGMGRLMVNAVNHRDYPLAQAAFFLMAAIVIILNFVVDLLYVVLDPRVNHD